jgi:hypothetical protein
VAKQNSSKVELVDERFVPLDEAFATLGVSPSKGYLLAREGKLPIRKAGRKSGVLYSDLLRYLRSLPIKTGSSEPHRERALRRWAAHRAEAQEV